MSWITQKLAGGTFLSWQPLLLKGINHGFGAADFSYHRDRAKQFENELSHALGVDRIFQAHQVHGKGVFSIGVPLECKNADIIIGQFSNEVSNAAIFIKTADCVPLIGVGRTEVVLIHAGWRGLVSGAVQEGLSRVKDLTTVLVGPSANICCYEVGKEIIDLLGEKAVFSERAGRYFLSTGRTAARIAASFLDSESIHNADICTICKSKYNSYRRSGNEERNITFAGIFCDPVS